MPIEQTVLINAAATGAFPRFSKVLSTYMTVSPYRKRAGRRNITSSFATSSRYFFLFVVREGLLTEGDLTLLGANRIQARARAGGFSARPRIAKLAGVGTGHESNRVQNLAGLNRRPVLLTTN